MISAYMFLFYHNLKDICLLQLTLHKYWKQMVNQILFKKDVCLHFLLIIGAVIYKMMKNNGEEHYNWAHIQMCRVVEHTFSISNSQMPETQWGRDAVVCLPQPTVPQNRPRCKWCSALICGLVCIVGWFVTM